MHGTFCIQIHTMSKNLTTQFNYIIMQCIYIKFYNQSLVLH